MEVELSFVGTDGVERREPFNAAADVLYEAAQPFRSFRSFKGQHNYPGVWWSATNGRHVGFESWLERDTAMMPDFDPDVTAYSCQPFQLHRRDEEGLRRRHIPDWFARLAGGRGLVVGRSSAWR